MQVLKVCACSIPIKILLLRAMQLNWKTKCLRKRSFVTPIGCLNTRYPLVITHTSNPPSRPVWPTCSLTLPPRWNGREGGRGETSHSFHAGGEGTASRRQGPASLHSRLFTVPKRIVFFCLVRLRSGLRYEGFKLDYELTSSTNFRTESL